MSFHNKTGLVQVVKCQVVRFNISIHNIKNIYIYIYHQGPVCDVGSGYTAKREHDPGSTSTPPMFKPKLRPCLCVSVCLWQAVELHLLIDLSTKSKDLLGL